MRDVFTQTVHDPRVTIAEGTFDRTGVESGWADLVVIAQVSACKQLKISYLTFIQAFHWCPDYDVASAEFARILKLNGIVVFIWNLEDRCVLVFFCR
jgi:hypothetical protein